MGNLPFALGKGPLAILALAVLLVLCGLLFFHRLADRDLWSSHEGRAAQDAQTILASGSWGLPRLFDHKVDLQKPPLYYWSAAALAWIRGGQVDAWAVRLPAAFAGLGGVLGLYGLCWRRRRAKAGWMGAAALATMQHYTWLARTGRIDMPLTLAIAAALGGFYLGYERTRNHSGRGAWVWFFLSYVAVAGAVLLKGPIGVVLPAAVAGVYLLVEGAVGRQSPEGRQKTVKRPRHRLPSAPCLLPSGAWSHLAHQLGLWWGLPLVVVLTAPWYWWAGIHTDGAWLRTFLWHHNVERALGGSSGHWSHPWWWYGPRLAVDLLPWSLLLPAAGWYLWRQGWRADPEARFGLVWLVTMVAVLSCAGFKRADYLLPAYPGAALLLGCAGERWSLPARRCLAAVWPVIVLGCASGWAVYVGCVLPRQEPEREYRRFAAEIRRLAPAPQPVIFFRTEAHALAFHIGCPLESILEWENLDWWVARPERHYVVMPAEMVEEWQSRLKAGRLETLLRNTDFSGGCHKQPLILLHTCPAPADPGCGEMTESRKSG